MKPGGLMDVPYRIARRIAVTVAGVTVVLIGLVLLVTPGPGIVVLTIGLAILALEFAWARRWLDRIKQAASDSIDHFAGSKPGAPEAHDATTPAADATVPPDPTRPPEDPHPGV